MKAKEAFFATSVATRIYFFPTICCFHMTNLISLHVRQLTLGILPPCYFVDILLGTYYREGHARIYQADFGSRPNLATARHFGGSVFPQFGRRI